VGVEFSFTTDVNEFINFNGPKINYSKQAIDNEIFITATNLLFETGINEQTVSVQEFRKCKVLFPNKTNTVIPFDPLAACFYMVTRYEEYLPYIKDEYDRFDAKSSIAHQNNFLTKPVVNIWASMIKQIIQERFPHFQFQKKKYSFVPTIDIDNAYAYCQKGIVRSIGAFARAIWTQNFSELKERIRVIFGPIADPYDSYDFMLNLHRQYDLHPVFFILFSDYGELDRNISTRNRHFQLLIKSISDYAEVGIHPSNSSNHDKKKLSKEIDQLSKVLNKEIRNSRQHFLKLSFPTTYRNLINLDITNDYSMGFASQPGFRAGICTSYPFYDLDLEKETKLIIHPFAMMDSTLRKYLKLSTSEASDLLKQLIDEVKAVNGTFVSLWHNESLGTSKEWQGWSKVYADMINYAMP